ncbi:hypothetical protein COV16_02385 [Candidatus Woesearchaeota archaeon CG10_big_fil_rev_8_21_14_0_10_34_8]|nr:MAG: hypothetical protein COV16_02385 [Candidatus Woesearchaeota archaeon CG10_big_fil_rev_8_21_14_0_10_34_8]
MKKVIKQTVNLGFGVSTLTQEQVKKFTTMLMKKQGINEREAKKVAKSMLKKSIETQRKVNKTVMDAASTFFNTVGLATKKDIADLRKEIRKKKSKKTNKK